MTKPFLSILVPTFNRADLLKRCLESILVFESDRFEVLVANNASEDHTSEVLESFDDPRLRYWRNPRNLGPGQNILDLLQASKGEWIFLLTDDDFLLPGALARLMELLSSEPEIGVVLSTLLYVDTDGNRDSIYQFYPRTEKLAAGFDALFNMVWAAHIFSRITLKREWVDLEGGVKHLPSLYPQMYWLGSVLKEHPGYYLHEPLVAHTIGNPVAWEYSDDYMVGGRIKLIRDLLPGRKWKPERQALINQNIRQIAAHHMSMSLKHSMNRWLTQQVALSNCLNVLFSSIYWEELHKFTAEKAIDYEFDRTVFIKGRRFSMNRYSMLPRERRFALSVKSNRDGELFWNMGDNGRAERCFHEAVKACASNAEAWNNLGVVMWERGDVEQARSFFQRAVAIEPTNQDVLLNLESLSLPQGEGN